MQTILERGIKIASQAEFSTSKAKKYVEFRVKLPPLNTRRNSRTDVRRSILRSELHDLLQTRARQSIALKGLIETENRLSKGRRELWGHQCAKRFHEGKIPPAVGQEIWDRKPARKAVASRAMWEGGGAMAGEPLRFCSLFRVGHSARFARARSPANRSRCFLGRTCGNSCIGIDK